MSATILTDAQIEQGREATFSTNNPYCPCDSKTMRKAARWAEQAVLQSPEVQAWKRDADRLDWLADPNNHIGNVQLPTECVIKNAHSLRAAIDAAMERKT